MSRLAKKFIRANLQITANPATSSSTQRGQPQRPALRPMEQALWQQAFGIF